MAAEDTFALMLRTGISLLIQGYQYKEPPAEAKLFSGSSAVSAQLPPKVDLRPRLTAVEDQQQTMSCVANAVAGAYEYLQSQHLQESYDTSRLFVYYNSRLRHQPDGVTDEGTNFCDAIQSLQELGACAEEVWPFDPELVNQEPADEAYGKAADFLVEEAEIVPNTLELWKCALAEGSPIMFALKLFQSFDQQRQGVVPMPNSADVGRGTHGGHAMLCVGYSDVDKVFIVRNSWGEQWGDKGYCYVPYSYMMNESLRNGNDAWVIKRVDFVEPDQETWIDDEESILEDIEGYIHGLSDGDYDALVEAMGDTPLEVRLALLFLSAARADATISDQEVAIIAGYLGAVLKQLGSDLPADELIYNTLPMLADGELIQDSIDRFASSIDNEVLASIVNQIIAISEADGNYGEDEDNFVVRLVEAWQVELEESDEECEPESEEELDEESEEESDQESEEESDEELEEESEEEDPELVSEVIDDSDEDSDEGV